MKKYLLPLTVLLIIAWVGCQPKEQADGLAGKDRIEEPVPPTAPTTIQPSGTIDEREDGLKAPSDEAPLPDVDPQTPGEATVLQDVDVKIAEKTTPTPPPATSGKPETLTANEQTPTQEETEEAAIASTGVPDAMAKKDSKETRPAEADDGLDKPDSAELIGPRVYAACRDMLSTYVDKDGNVDYSTLRRKRGELYSIVRDFEALDPREYLPWSRNEKIAFWLNAYNVFTLKVVIDNYPIEPSWPKVMLNYPKNSVVHISDPWTKKYFKVMDIEWTLREIEREKLLGQYGDPRVCLALSYASMGGAMLRNEPFYPDKLDAQLDDQARRFLADSRGFEIDATRGTVYLADIFNWYKQDFIAKYGSIPKFRDKPQHIQAYLNFVANYVSSDNMRYLETQNYTVEFRKYDWRLNERANK